MFKRFLKDILKPEASLNDKQEVKETRKAPELSEDTKKIFGTIETSDQFTEEKVFSRYGIKRSR